MKTLMLLLAIVLISTNLALSQTGLAITGPSVVCPNTQTVYTVYTSDNAIFYCNFRWTVTGGRFYNSVRTGTEVIVIWDDLPGTGSLKVNTIECPSGLTNNVSVTKSGIVRISVFGRNLTGISPNSQDADVCATPSILVAIQPMTITGTGGSGQPGLRAVDGYRWIIPAGWKLTNTTITGPTEHITTATSILVTPTGIASGDVSVQAFVSNSCGGTGFSNPKAFSLRRTPILAFTPASLTVSCGQTGQVTFSIPSYPCGSVSWTRPSGWGFVSSTPTSVTVTPNGDNGGILKVTVTFPTGTLSKEMTINHSPTVPMPISITDNNPYYELCANDAWVYTVNPPAGYVTNFGYDWYATGGIILNQSASSASSPIHATGNSTLVNVTSSSYGQQTINVRMNNLSVNCASSAYISIPIRVGVYNNTEFSIIGPQMVCANQAADFRSSFITPDVTSYQWSAPQGWGNSGQGTPYFSVSVPSPFFGGAITKTSE